MTINELDMFYKMFRMQEHFMAALQTKNGYDVVPDWPVDIAKKQNQQLCKSLAFDSMCELFEAVQHLKNSKPHRNTEIKEFDREAFKEELVDSFKFFLELLIFVGITPDEFYEAYSKKDKIIHQRLVDNY